MREIIMVGVNKDNHTFWILKINFVVFAIIIGLMNIDYVAVSFFKLCELIRISFSK